MSEADKKPAPSLCPGNPGIGTEAKLDVTGPNGPRTEDVNVVTIIATVLGNGGHAVVNEVAHLRHPDSGFTILPQLVGVQLLDDGGVQSVTTVQVNHAALTPAGVFEYQHSTGNTLVKSVATGFKQWMETDFVTLLDAARTRPEVCTFMELVLPPREGRPQRVRRAILGPVGHFVQQRPTRAEPEEHPFCPCCLLTQSFEAFRDLFEGEGFHGLRLFAVRDAEGNAGADCRVNGEEWERGKEALCEYVQTWPGAGVEFRKQYVILQSVEKETNPLPP